MEKRALIALGLSFLVFLIFMYIGEKSRQVSPPAEKVEAPAALPEASPPAPAAAKPEAPVPPPSRPPQEVVVDTPLYRAVFTELGGSLLSFELKKYRETLPFASLYSLSLGPVAFEVERYQDPKTAETANKQLIRTSPVQALPLGVSWQGEGVDIPARLLYEASDKKIFLQEGESRTLRFRAVSPEGVAITKTYKFNPQTYAFDLEVTLTNRTAETLQGNLGLALSTGEDPTRKGYLAFASSWDKRYETINQGKLKEPKTFTGGIKWAGLDEGYFLLSMSPRPGTQASVTVTSPAASFLTTTLKTPQTLPPGQQLKADYTLYFGPKDLDDLKKVNLGLEQAVDFGWFHILAMPLLYLLKFINRFFNNYGWSLVVLTLLTRLVFWWPNHKSYKSMKEMQKLQPKVAKIREKYKDDREAMNRELMALYRTFKVNPLGSCLPMFLQLPVFIALYNILSYAIELRHASFIPTLPFTDIVWLADLSAKDPLLITPIVMGVSMVIQQKMSPSPGDPAQAKMMMFLPIIFTFLFLNFASGLVIYWLVNNILAIVQQYFTNKYIA
jgi:YidC/Oxa1 family membrane protein insertase|uniref:Membrane protein insertase YidC n=1 Tax=Desulfobacca acetoxidans TaxID=60893 RepID=A0A7C3SIH6_9BACT